MAAGDPTTDPAVPQDPGQEPTASTPAEAQVSTERSWLGLVGVAGLAALASIFPLLNFDVWWHLATGRQILAGGGIPRAETFSHTAAGTPWIDHEWLFQVIVTWVFDLGGVNGLIALRAVLLASIAGLVYRAVERHGLVPGPALALLLVPFVLAGRARFLMRPELFTLLFLVVLLDGLFRPRREPPALRSLAWIPLLFALWANIHAALVVGLAILGVHAAARTFEGLLGNSARGRPSIATSWGLLLASTAACLANPYGYRIFEVPFHLAAINTSGVIEAFEARPPTLDAHGLFFVMVAVSALLALAMLARDRQRVHWPALGALALLAALAVRYVRNIAIFSFLAPVLLAALLALHRRSGEAPWASRLGQWLHPVTTTLGLLLLGGSLVVSGGGLGANAMLPVKAADLIEEHRPPGNLFNMPDAYGGYLAWRLAPEVPIYFDGRNDVFFEVWKTFREVETRQGTWREHLEERDIGIAVVGYLGVLQPVQLMDFGTGEPRTVYRPWAANHFPRREWALVHWDDGAMLYVRRRPENEALIAEHEDRHVYPEDSGYQLEMIGQGRASKDEAIRELLGRLEADPESQRIQALLQAVRQAPDRPSRPAASGETGSRRPVP